MMQRPSKRSRLDANSPAVPSQVKHEPSIFRLEAVERRLVTSGAKRYTPVPIDCLSSNPEYKRNRSEWIARCAQELEVLNLIPGRKLFRDDGLVIDWKSHVPVWSDTLKPDSLDLAATIMLAHTSNAQLRHPATLSDSLENASGYRPSYGARSTAKRKLPVLPRPSVTRQSNTSQLTPSRENTLLPRPERLQIASTSDQPLLRGTSTSPDHIPSANANGRGSYSSSTASISPCTSAAEGEMSEMTLVYLRRYVQTYEADRASLASAYANNASFSYRVHHIVPHTIDGASSIRTASPQCFSSGTKRTRLNITTTLLTLPCLHSGAQSSAIVRLDYDMFYLGAQLGMFVVCRVVGSTKTVVHNFILQRKEVDAEDAAIEGVWPLTATAHQILVFET